MKLKILLPKLLIVKRLTFFNKYLYAFIILTHTFTQFTGAAPIQLFLAHLPVPVISHGLIFIHTVLFLVIKYNNLCFTTHHRGTLKYLCIAGDTDPIIQQFLSQCRTLCRMLSACLLFHTSAQVCLFRLPITSFFFVPLQGITSPYGSIKKVSKLISQGNRRFCPQR